MRRGVQADPGCAPATTITGVYDAMLARQPLRFLLADDPRAGKTIMAGLLIKELVARGDLERCLIVLPRQPRIQNAALLHPIRSNARAIAGEMPVRPLSSREKVCRVHSSHPSSTAVTVVESPPHTETRHSNTCASSSPSSTFASR